MVLRVAVVGCTSIGIRHALACVGDERALPPCSALRHRMADTVCPAGCAPIGIPAGWLTRSPPSHAGVTLVAACDDGYADNGGDTAAEVGAKFAATYAEDFPDLRIYSNHKEMLAAEDLDIVTW